MALYALVGPNDVVNRVVASIDPNTGTKAGYRWLPFVEQPDPAYDSETQTLESPITTVEAKQVVRFRSVRDLTAQEITDRVEAMKDHAIDRLTTGNRVILQALFILVNDVRQLKGQNTITKQQYISALRGLL